MKNVFFIDVEVVFTYLENVFFIDMEVAWKNVFFIYICCIYRNESCVSCKCKTREKTKISAVASLEFPQTAQQQEPGSKEKQTDYVKDGIAKQTLP